MFFFVVAPFCSCPASLVSRKIFCCRPRVCKVFCFLLRSVGRRDLSAGPEQKKKHHPGCFFFLLRPRGKAGEGEAPCRHGARAKKKKHHPGCFFFAVPNGASPSLAFRRGRSNKKTPWVVFFFLLPAPRGRSLTHCGPGWRCLPLAGVVFFFLLRPRRVFLDNSKKCLGLLHRV